MVSYIIIKINHNVVSYLPTHPSQLIMTLNSYIINTNHNILHQLSLKKVVKDFFLGVVTLDLLKMNIWVDVDSMII